MMITVEQFELIQRMAKVYATTIYKAYSIDVIMTMMLRAHGLGLPVTEAPELFQQLHGKLTLSANAMATLIKRAGYSWIVNSLDDDRAELTIYDNAGHELGQSIFTIEDAQQAGIMGKNKNWDNYPRNMLMARALSNAAKWFAPDAFGGAPIYTPDELGSDDDTGYIEPMEPTPPPSNVTDMPEPAETPAIEASIYFPMIEPDHFSNFALEGESTKQQRKDIGIVANALWPDKDTHKACKANFILDYTVDPDRTSTTKLTPYEAEIIKMLMYCELLGLSKVSSWNEGRREAAAVWASGERTGDMFALEAPEVYKLYDHLLKKESEIKVAA